MSHVQRERNDALDGLRALAVAAVMAFHFGLPGASGGFLGVDIFFVLSGYLITRLLVSQVAGGRLDLLGFWVRRIRRLAPALLVAVAVVIAWGAFIAPAVVRDGLRADITATLAYVANWHFINSSSYFSATGDDSPLQHMWSLAVEEQFYLVWPIALFVVAKTLRSTSHRMFAIGAIALAGLVFSAWRLQSIWSAASPDRGYMGTDSRMFGPMAGALLAIVLTVRPRIGSGRAANALLLGVGAILVSWGLASLGSPEGATRTYADGGALIVALGSASVVWAIAVRRSPATIALGTAPIAYLGRLSYGIYIWHWPLIVWAGRGGWLDLSSKPPALRDISLAVATVALASLSYHAVEKPVRYGGVGAFLGRGRTVLALPAVLGVLVAVNSVWVVPQAGAVEGEVTRTIVLVGDSVPQRLATDFSRAAATRGYVVISATRGGCPATGVTVVDAAGRLAGEGASCQSIVSRRQDSAIKRYRPALVIWWSRYEIADRLAPDGLLLKAGTDAYWRAQEASFTRRAAALTALGAQLVAVQIERSGMGMTTRCTSRSCGSFLYRLIHRTDLQGRWNAFLAGYRGHAVHSISINGFVCHNAASPCDDHLDDGKPARPDGTHYSPEAGPAVVQHVFFKALAAAGLSSRGR